MNLLDVFGWIPTVFIHVNFCFLFNQMLCPLIERTSKSSCHLLLMYPNFVETSPDYLPQTPSQPKKKVGASSGKTPLSNLDKHASHSNHKQGGRELERTPETVYQSHGNGHASSKQEKRTHMPTRPRKEQSSLVPSSPSAEDVDDDDVPAVLPEREANGRVHKASHANNSFGKDGHQISTRSQSKVISRRCLSPFKSSCFALVC